MKKISGLLVFLVVMSVTGCSSRANSGTNVTSETTSEKNDYVSYQDLENKDKKLVKIKVTSDSVAKTISVNIQNNSNKTVKFDSSKFTLVDHNNRIIKSNFSKIFLLKKGQSRNLKDTFRKLDEKVFTTDKNVIQYLNDDNVLAEINHNKIE